VYVYRDTRGEVLYVGKAASLRDRVRSYFSTSALEPKTAQMVRRIADFSFIVTDSEQEALILENSLIKRHRPRYNVRLRDDKTYPYLKIDVRSDYPRVCITRRIESDGARYFGPYASSSSVRTTLQLIKRLFPYRSCNRDITGCDARPCLDYHLNRCVGPCIGATHKQGYREAIDQVIEFLEGRNEAILRTLRARMRQASAGLQFERAGVLRDQMRAVEQVSERQKVFSQRAEDIDVIALASSGDDSCAEALFVRRGRLIDNEHYAILGTKDESPSRVLTSFVKQYYGAAAFVPKRLLLQYPLEEPDLIARWLAEKRGGRVELVVPRRGEKRKFVRMAEENARQALHQMRVQWLADVGKTQAAAEELGEALELATYPKRIECYDISNIQGTSATGSMVVFEDGRPKPSLYRRFRIKSVAGANDYAMLQEVLRRRFRRAASGDGRPSEAQASEWAHFPDLLIVDGGKGQLSAALETLSDLAVFVPLMALAKEREEVFLPGRAAPLVLTPNSQALYLLQRIRDEAHRFALAYHQRLRSRASMESGLDAVPGIGPKRRKALLRRFGSLRALREAEADDIAAVPGMTRTLALRLKDYL